MSVEQYNALTGKKKPRVKNARKKELNGITFDSTREARRYQDLELMQQGGQIFELRRQVPFPIKINGFLICTYVADFVYREQGQEVVEDSKGFVTEVYKMKRKLVGALYGIKIRET